MSSEVLDCKEIKKKIQNDFSDMFKAIFWLPEVKVLYMKGMMRMIIIIWILEEVIHLQYHQLKVATYCYQLLRIYQFLYAAVAPLIYPKGRRFSHFRGNVMYVD